MSNSSALLAAGFSSIFCTDIVTEDELGKTKETTAGVCPEKLTMESLFRATYSNGLLGDKPLLVGDGGQCKLKPLLVGDGGQCKLFVKTLSGNTYHIDASPAWEVSKVMEEIKKIDGTSADQQRLIIAGRQLEVKKTLSDYNVSADSEICVYLVLRLRGGGGCLVRYMDSSLLDPSFDFDFTTLKCDGKVYYRGDFPYYRPYGWKRYALKVTGKFENDDWLGIPGNRTHSTKEEWPVSYHGTATKCAQSISDEGYKLSKGRRFKFGEGIYSTPSIEVAEMFALDFQFKGERYKLVFQNRCNPDPAQLEVIGKDKTEAGGEYWVSRYSSDLRPYGICIKRVNKRKMP